MNPYNAPPLAVLEPRPRLSLEERKEAAEALGLADWSRAGEDWPLPCLARLEEEWAAAHAVPYAVAVSSGTAGLTLVLQALEIPAGDEVLVPAYGCPAVDVAVLAAGLTPVHVDIDPNTYSLSPLAAAAAVTPRTAAIIAVHFAGQPAALGPLQRIAERYGLTLVEDACLAPGARYEGRSVGGWGRAGVFSLGVRKPISAGEGGVVTTSDARLVATLRRLRALGADPDSGDIHVPTGNFRLTELQAAVALPQLRSLEAHIARRAHAAEQLRNRIAEVPFLRTLDLLPGTERHTWAQLWLRFDEESAGISRNRFVEAVQAEGVPLFAGWTRPSYCLAMYTPQRAAEWLRARGSGREPDHYERTHCPHAEHAAFGEALLLDFPILDAEPNAVQDTAEAIAKVAAGIDKLRS